MIHWNRLRIEHRQDDCPAFANLDPMHLPAAGGQPRPFHLGQDPESVEGMVVLEHWRQWPGNYYDKSEAAPNQQALLDKHYLRKHGKTPTTARHLRANDNRRRFLKSEHPTIMGELK